jgi:hypothetical protein
MVGPQPANRGVSLFATAFPSAVGIDLLLADGGGSAHCSGVLIGPATVLTAAHCICGSRGTWDASDAKECLRFIDRVSATVLVPGRGLFRAVRGPEVNPDYVSAKNGKAGQASADLAILHLERPVAAKMWKTASAHAPGNHVSVASGAFSFLTVPAGSAYRAGVEYNAGPTHIAVIDAIATDGRCAGRLLTDTFCAVYSGVPSTRPQDASVMACPGDSGSPIFQIEAGKDPVVVGITSNRWSGMGDRCVAQQFSGAITYSVDLGVHQFWLSQNIDQAPPQPEQVCGDGVAPPGEIALNLGRATFTVTPVDWRVNPTVEIAPGPGAACEDLNNGGFACSTEPGSRPILRTDRALVQIVACWERTS